MNKIFLIFLFLITLKADILNEFKNHEYNKICLLDNITKTTNEKILSIIGYSCLKSDRLFLLPYIVVKLKFSKIARENAIYLNTIYLQKRLLYSFFYDNLSLKEFDLPITDYIISIVFYKIKHNEYKKEGKIFIIKYKNETIRVYPKDTRLYIDEYINGKLKKRHWYK